MHRINLEYNAKSTRNMQHKLNLRIKEVVQKEVVKLSNVRIIYLFFESPCVSPMQVVPKNSDITVVKNNAGESYFPLKRAQVREFVLITRSRIQ